MFILPLEARVGPIVTYLLRYCASLLVQPFLTAMKTYRTLYITRFRTYSPPKTLMLKERSPWVD